jgi:hypothetical protein
VDVVSISPFRAGSVLWRPRPDRWTLTVVCKGTYALAPGESGLASEQDEVNTRDVHWDDDDRRSVRAPDDLAPFKPRVDVTLVGHAYAPRSELARSLVARLMVGEMAKAVEVFAPRVLTRDGELREGPRWSQMPLRYEYTAGGPETWNPVGISETAPADAYGQHVLPSLQPEGLRAKQWRDIFVPTGFGPIAQAWELRREKLGRRAEGWSEEGWTKIPLDDDFDGEFFQAAPSDQQIDAFHEEEQIVLEYLNPDHPRLATRLVKLHPHAFVDIPGASPRDLVMTADTLWIDTDRAICTVTWRGQIAVDGPDQPGRVLIAIEEQGQRLTWPSVAALAGLPAGGTVTVDPVAARRPQHTLPFHEPTSVSAVSASRPGPGHEEGHPPAPGPAPVTRRQTMEMTPGDAPAPMPPAWILGTANRVPEAPPPPAIAQSDVAADSQTKLSVRVPPPKPSSPTAAPPEPAAAFELVWAAPGLARRLRADPVWARLLSTGEQAPELDAARVLSSGEPRVGHLADELFEAVGEAGTLAPALLLLEGDLAFPFDEVKTLTATLAAAAPIAGADPRLAEMIDLASGMAKTPLQASPEVAEALSARLRELWAQANHVLPSNHLEAQVQRSLLMGRCYQRRELLGRAWIRALFTTAEGACVPAYLPTAMARSTPLFERFPARLIAEVVPQQDAYEESPVALRVSAVARVVRRG